MVYVPSDFSWDVLYPMVIPVRSVSTNAKFQGTRDPRWEDMGGTRQPRGRSRMGSKISHGMSHEKAHAEIMGYTMPPLGNPMGDAYGKITIPCKAPSLYTL